VPVVLLPGNHDPALPDCLFRRAGIAGLSNAHVLGVTNAGSILSEQHDLEIWGHPHRDLSDMAPLHKPRPRTTRWQVVMAHGHYVPPPDLRREAHRSWKIVDGDIAATEAHYIALGHWDRAVAVGDGSVPAYYSGSPDLAGTVNAVRLSYANGVIVERVPLTWVQ
jgi:DNA repair exonuclease SbcCD nuclease subunit